MLSPMKVLFRCESDRLQFTCISGCGCDTGAFTRFVDSPRWLDYCDECASSVPWTDVSMYIKVVRGKVIYEIYNRYDSYPLRSFNYTYHDFRLSKI